MIEHVDSIREKMQQEVRAYLQDELHLHRGVLDKTVNGLVDRAFDVLNVPTVEQDMTPRAFKERFYSPERLAELMLKFVNILGHESDSTIIIDVWIKAHRTLKQSLTRLLCLWFIRNAFSDYDARNEASVKLSRDVAELVKNYPLPLI
jgi:hypothetical protein